MLDALDPVVPSPDFTDRVRGRLDAERTAPLALHRYRRAAAIAAGLLAAVIGAYAVWRPARPVSVLPSPEPLAGVAPADLEVVANLDLLRDLDVIESYDLLVDGASVEEADGLLDLVPREY